ncbi:hypothetical protein [Flavobacterium sp. 1355]|uniref:hypothetical protein n=1 Tax=Flavobacterium sp. 1355 TaxID=2806571 RepID=UPI001AE2E69E|nr:hypothetical protein [Flavobacterium sp. 1355]MBP1225476.1 hypothetical protein [Flavobacterium sp. 1355]
MDSKFVLLTFNIIIMNTTNHRNSRSDNEGIVSETMETKDPAINQHQNDSSGRRDYETDNSYENSDRKHLSENDDTDDPYFQKNSNIAQDLDEDLKNDNDPDRRTLDEYSANKAEPDDDEEDDE